jgi:hypothetical protein
MTIVAIHGSENGSENLQFSLMMTSCARTNSPDLAISLNSLDASFAHDRVIYTYSKVLNVSRCASELTFSSARGLIYSTPLDENGTFTSLPLGQPLIIVPVLLRFPRRSASDPMRLQRYVYRETAESLAGSGGSIVDGVSHGFSL